MSESRLISKSSDPTPPSSFGAKRTVAPTRSATARTKDISENPPSRSQTLPANTSASRVARPPKVPEKGNTLTATGYDEEGRNGTPPMPIPDVRSSGSSFQTEPSSYYSADDNISSYGPAPPMPVPQPERKDTVERLVDSLWQEAQLSTTPPADGGPPPMPTPHVAHHNDRQHFHNQDQEWVPHQPLGMPNSQLQRDVQSYNMSSAAPGMPQANVSDSPAESLQTFDDSLDDYPYPGPDDGHEGADAAAPSMPTAPLRVQHGGKPTSPLPSSTFVVDPISGSTTRPPGMPVPTASSTVHRPTGASASAQARPPGPTPQFTPFHPPASPVTSATAAPPANTHSNPRPDTHSRPESRPTAPPTGSGSHAHVPSQSQPAKVTTQIPSKNSLGEQTTFYYDPVQKRWVNKKVEMPVPGRADSVQSQSTAQPGAAPATGASSAGVSSRPSASHSNARPHGVHGASDPAHPHNQDTSSHAKLAGRPHAFAVVNSSSQDSIGSSQKPTPVPTTQSQQTNVRPQNVNSGLAKPTSPTTPQQASSVRPHQTANMLPTKTHVVVHPPQQEYPRPQNGGAAGAAKPNNSAASQSSARPQAITQTSRPQATHSQISTSSHAAAPKPQQQPSTSHLSAHKPDPPPTPAASKPEPAPPTAPAKPAKMTGAVPTRRHDQLSQFDTQYVNMLLALDDIPFTHNAAAGFFSWILLAGFILFPGTFASLQNLDVPADQVTGQLIHAVTNLPLFIVAWVCCAVGACGMCWLWYRWRKNYLWAVNKIFLPGLMNSLAGFISTIANIYGVQHGQYSTTSKITIIVTGASLVIFCVLFLFYTFWLIRNVKKKHDQEVGKQRAGKYGEGVVDLSKRKQ